MRVSGITCNAPGTRHIRHTWGYLAVNYMSDAILGGSYVHCARHGSDSFTATGYSYLTLPTAAISSPPKKHHPSRIRRCRCVHLHHEPGPPALSILSENPHGVGDGCAVGRADAALPTGALHHSERCAGASLMNGVWVEPGSARQIMMPVVSVSRAIEVTFGTAAESENRLMG